jgi:hypothetical protein
MSLTPKFTCKIKNGELEYKNPKRFYDYLKGLPTDKDLELVLKEKRTQRSLEQNAWYWGVALKLISEHTGYETKDIHEILKSEFLKDFYEFKGKVYPIIRSTSDLNTKEFSEFMGRVQRWAVMRLQVSIPDPNEVDYSNLIYQGA